MKSDNYFDKRYATLIDSFSKGVHEVTLSVIRPWVDMLAPNSGPDEERKQVRIGINNSEEERWIREEVLSRVDSEEEMQVAAEHFKKAVLNKAEDVMGRRDKTAMMAYRLAYGLQKAKDNPEWKIYYSKMTGLKTTEIGAAFDCLTEVLDEGALFRKHGKRLTVFEPKPAKELSVAGITHSNNFRLDI